LSLAAPVGATEQPVRAGGRVRAQPVADIDGQHDAALVAAWYLLGGNNVAEPTDVNPAMVETVVQTAMTAPVLHGQRQLRQGHHRPVGAQRRIAQRIGPGSQAIKEPLPETR
jgi:hypothetical protein